VKGRVLVIRFNSIGDIVLSYPAVRTLSRAGYEVHYLTKASFAELVTSNPFVAKVWLLKDSLHTVVDALVKIDWIYVFDFHNNYRSKTVVRNLDSPSFTLEKNRIGMWIMIQLNLRKKQQRHIVERYLDTIALAGIQCKDSSLEVYIPDNLAIPDLPEVYLAIAVGTAWHTKSIPVDKIVETINLIPNTAVILLGGPDDKQRALDIKNGCENTVIDLTSELSILQSAKVVMNAAAILTGDTGLMHIEAAVGTPIVAVFGSTHPLLGYTPYTDSEKAVVIQVEDLPCRPCTKQGKNSCPKGHFKCMKNINTERLVEEINNYI